MAKPYTSPRIELNPPLRCAGSARGLEVYEPGQTVFHGFEPATVLRGLFVPEIPSGGATAALSLIGGIGGSLTLLSYNYLLRDEGKADPRNLRAVRLDLATAYLSTAM